MKRFLLSLAVVVLFSISLNARVMAPPAPAARAMQASTVVVGTVTAIDPKPHEVKQPANPANPLEYKMATIKVEENLLGASGLTHLKVGVLSTPGGRRTPISVNVQEGQRAIFFLHKHPTEGFDTFDYMSQPLDLKSEAGKSQLESVKQVTSVIADPKAALAASTPAERLRAAAILISRARHPVAGTGEPEMKPLALNESQLMLKALAEGDWTIDEGKAAPSYVAFSLLGLTKADGWEPVKPTKGGNFIRETQAAFRTWLDGPGKEYRIKSLVAKSK